MKKIIIITSIFATFFTFGMQGNEEKMTHIHAEVITAHNAHINYVTANTHPTLYALIEKIVQKAHTDMPPYIKLSYEPYNYEITENGECFFSFLPKDHVSVEPYITFMGDLCMYEELVLISSYEQLEGLIALAIAETVVRKNLIVTLSAIGGFSITRFMFKKAWLETVQHSKFLIKMNHITIHEAKKNLLDFALLSIIAPLYIAYLTGGLSSLYLQKTIDFKAAQFTDPKNIINGLRGLRNIVFEYEQTQKITLFEKLLYPIMPFSIEQRIAYLEKAFPQKATA